MNKLDMIRIRNKLNGIIRTTNVINKASALVNKQINAVYEEITKVALKGNKGHWFRSKKKKLPGSITACFNSECKYSIGGLCTYPKGLTVCINHVKEAKNDG